MIRMHALLFPSEPAHSPWLHLVERLRLECDSLTSGPDIPGDPDVILFNLDLKNYENLFRVGLFARKSRKIAFVSELSYTNLSTLKMADHVFYQSHFQKQYAEEYFGMFRKSEVLPYPSMAAVTAAAGDCLLFFNNEFELVLSGGIRRQLKKALSGFAEADIPRFHACFKVKPENEAAFGEFIGPALAECGRKVEVHNIYAAGWGAVLEMAAQCGFGEYISYEFQAEEFEGMVEKKSANLINLELRASPIISEMISRGMKQAQPHPGITGPLSVAETGIPSIRETLERIASVAAMPPAERVFRLPAPDRMEDLGIVQGKVLSNKYVFSVCFRNQRDKIERCLYSITKQNRELDFGIAIIDDGSEDGSLEAVKKVFEANPTDHIIVSNKERKFAARNFYNVIHLLTDRPDGVILEVDGDDFLPNREVLDEVHARHAAGYLKTNGSFSFYPEDLNFSKRKEKMKFHAHLDFENPWNVSRCNAWLPLRTCARKILAQVGIEFFLDRNTGTWLKTRHDSAIQPRAIELCAGKASKIDKVLYVYDLSGDDHDHVENAKTGTEHFEMIRNLCGMHHPFIVEKIDHKGQFSFY